MSPTPTPHPHAVSVVHVYLPQPFLACAVHVTTTLACVLYMCGGVMQPHSCARDRVCGMRREETGKKSSTGHPGEGGLGIRECTMIDTVTRQFTKSNWARLARSCGCRWPIALRTDGAKRTNLLAYNQAGGAHAIHPQEWPLYPVRREVSGWRNRAGRVYW